ncbi:HEPN domain-containing protein [Mucilaginibacter sp. OK268]|uniref:HEPN domain-containing protein n=1 Tax=Mucilaginibacter sp. OK268 TaxID=1881048 RepID=UPI0008856CE7|nr:HEPN domain-containing protein [Mucilaginibacter sp. OK268]SDP99681.1 HEPN domain-containing protein [Mucilaginibacter sp. OK268]
MRLGYHAPWEHYPKNLYFEEVQNPYLVLNQFFGSWPDTHKKDLKQWRKAVTADTYFKGKPHGPGELLFISEQVVRLVEACYLLWVSYKGGHRHENLLTPKLLEKARQEWIYFPDDLSEQELLNPYKILKKTYKDINVQRYRDHLKYWLYGAMYNRPIHDDEVITQMKTIYRNLSQLYDAAWVIQQTEGIRTLIKHKYDKLQDEKEIAIKRSDKILSDKVPEIAEENLFIDPKAITIKPFEPKMTPAEKLGIDTVTGHLLKIIPTIRSITYLGSYPKPFTYYLLILVDDEEKMPEHSIVNKLIDNTKALTNIYPIVHKVQSAADGINSKGRFWSIVFEKGINVYTSEGLYLPTPHVLSPKQQKAAINANWKRWCTNGKEFFQGAKRYLEEGNNKLALFLLHQAAEHTLIGALQILFGYRQSVHSLSKLMSLTLLFTEDLVVIFSLDTEEGKEIFNLLQNGYSKARYDENFTADEEPVKTVTRLVGILLAKAEALYRGQLEQQNLSAEESI